MTVRQTEVLIVGGGLVGLSTAMYLQSMRPRTTIVLIDKDDRLAAQQSGHNSGVLHAGIYYETGSLKAKMCVEGHRAIQVFCERNNIPVNRCGKLIVGHSDEEIDQLERLQERGSDNGVADLQVIDQRAIREIEPHVVARRALYSPHSAIVDFRLVAETYAAVFRSHGGDIVLDCELLSASHDKGTERIETTAGEFEAQLVINCAGLHADDIARKSGVRPDLRIIPFRGEFYELREERRALVNSLVYPVPDPDLPFLGVHLTPTIDGRVKAGPNAVLAFKREGYERGDFELQDLLGMLTYGGFWWLAGRYWKSGIAELYRSVNKAAFVAGVRKMVPDITEEDLVASRAGVRAQAVDSRGRLIDDFHIEESPGAIHVLNAPSPAATSSLSIGRHIANTAEKRLGTN